MYARSASYSIGKGLGQKNANNGVKNIKAAI
jgi:hypothetical protein